MSAPQLSSRTSLPVPGEDGFAEKNRLARRVTGLALSVPFLFVIVFFGVPMIWLIIASLSTHQIGVPSQFTGTLEHYARFWLDPFYLEVIWTTVRLSVAATFICLIIGYVLAYYIAELPANRRGLITSLIIVTLSVSTVIRVFGLNVLLMNNGVLNNFFVMLGMPRLRIMYTELGVLIGLVQIAVPYVVVPLIGVLASIDPALKEAAASVGASKARTFWSVTVPLSMPGIIAGVVIVLTQSLSALVIPNMMGGGRVRMIGTLAYDQATTVGNLPFAAAIGNSLTVLTLVVTVGIIWLINIKFKAPRS